MPLLCWRGASKQGVFLQAHRALCLLRSESVTAASNEECPATACCARVVRAVALRDALTLVPRGWQVLRTCIANAPIKSG
ncbi:hypothetical protein XHC_4230 [Xanthomonas hortorum pv. carotae str. M081]|nr:hypothetical protein XHC_4230 [Xanthomonas hortorum pv. carotae str. M081]